MSQKTEIEFNLTPIEDKPSRKYRKGSKYDPILEAFKGTSKGGIVKVEVQGTDANYLRTQLKKRIDAEKINDIVVSVVNNQVYLEKV